MASRMGEVTHNYDSSISGAQAIDVSVTDVAMAMGQITRGVYVGATGNLAVTLVDGSTVTFVGLAAGVWHPMQVQTFKNSGTTATGIIAGF